VNEILEEAVDEAIGASSKRWALLLIAFVAGGVTVVWLVRRRRGLSGSDGERPESPGAQIDAG
jgi:hypothetical protein